MLNELFPPADPNTLQKYTFLFLGIELQVTVLQITRLSRIVCFSKYSSDDRTSPEHIILQLYIALFLCYSN